MPQFETLNMGGSPTTVIQFQCLPFHLCSRLYKCHMRARSSQEPIYQQDTVGELSHPMAWSSLICSPQTMDISSCCEPTRDVHSDFLHTNTYRFIGRNLRHKYTKQNGSVSNFISNCVRYSFVAISNHHQADLTFK